MTWRFWLVSLACAISAQGAEKAIPKVTPAPAGPYHVRGNRILDSSGREYLIRGTQLPPITLDEFDPFSGTTLITIRQRLNMNAVRLPVDAREYVANVRYRARVKEIAERANRFELLAILEPMESVDLFWAECAADFKTSPNVFFALSPGDDAQRAVVAIRSSATGQPIIVATLSEVLDSNIIYEVLPAYASLTTDRTRLDSVSARIPLVVSGLDPQLDQAGPECAAFPNDPGAASKLIEDLLTDFDEHSISWTISTLEPGRFIDSFRGYNWTKLDDGWSCGESPARAGIAMAVLSHLWSANPHGLFMVSQPAGGAVVARGGNASAYGPILADREVHANQFPLPVKLGNISVRVRDSQGIARLAPLSWTGAGWSSVNFVVPSNSALGPAEVAVVRSDGSTTAAMVIIAGVAPGLYTATADGRGPVIAQVRQRFSDARTAEFPAWTCSKYGCKTVPIPLTHSASTTVRMEGTGFRFVSSKAALRVTIDGIPVPVEAFGPAPGSSNDQITVKLPDELIGHGESDVVLTADGALSNVVRINIGSQ